MTDRSAGTDQYAAFARRMLRAYSRRARLGQVDINALVQLRQIQAELDEQMSETVAALRSETGGSYSWAQIGDALGVTRQAAQKRFGSADDAARRPGGQPSVLR